MNCSILGNLFFFNIKPRTEWQMCVFLDSSIKIFQWVWGIFQFWYGRGFPWVFLMLPRWGHSCCPPGNPAVGSLCSHAQGCCTDGDCWMLKGSITCQSHSAAPITAGCWVHCQLEWQQWWAAAVTDGQAPANLWAMGSEPSQSFSSL